MGAHRFTLTDPAEQKGIGALRVERISSLPVQQSVKEVIDELKSDGLLVSEKM